MRIESMHIYPLKSAAGIELASTTARPAGLDHDREWMLVDSRGRFLSARRYPQMLKIHARLTDNGVRLDYPDHPALEVIRPDNSATLLECSIWKDRLPARDAGNRAAEWCGSVLGTSCRLVWSGPESRRLLKPGDWPAIDIPADGRMLRFSDAMPILLCSSASLAELNAHLDEAVPMCRFRPNLVVDGEIPWAEEGWPSLRIGELVLQATKSCVRCILTTTDCRSGRRNPDRQPLRWLEANHAEAGRGAIFGMQFVARNEAVIRTGTKVQIG